MSTRPPVAQAATPIGIARRVEELRTAVAAWRRSGARVGLVPTMGALHDGHLALVRRALEAGERVVVSIFVNPTQFGPSEDFSAYPRREEEDLAKLGAIGAHLAWLPAVGEMYPEGFATTVTVAGVTEGLDGVHRPGHFQGVATVVAKLLLQALPDSAYFGEKDYQQLLVVRRLVRDLDIPVRVAGVPTVREPDGLALSSRNLYLSAAEREVASALPRVMRATVARAEEGAIPVAELLAGARAALIEAGFASVDYVALCDAETLQPVARLDRPARLLAAARVGRTRLIDNMPVVPPAIMSRRA